MCARELRIHPDFFEDDFADIQVQLQRRLTMWLVSSHLELQRSNGNVIQNFTNLNRHFKYFIRTISHRLPRGPWKCLVHIVNWTMLWNRHRGRNYLIRTLSRRIILWFSKYRFGKNSGRDRSNFASSCTQTYKRDLKLKRVVIAK